MVGFAYGCLGFHMFSKNCFCFWSKGLNVSFLVLPCYWKFVAAMLIPVSMTGVLDKYLSLVDACHVVGAMHLYKYWPLGCVWVTVCKCDKSWMMLRLVFPWLASTWQADGWLWVDSVFSTIEWPSVQGVGTPWSGCGNTLNTRWTVDKCTWMWMFARPRSCEKNVAGIHLAACAVRSCWHICQVHILWECGFTSWCVWMAMKCFVSHHFLTEGFVSFVFSRNLWICKLMSKGLMGAV